MNDAQADALLDILRAIQLEIHFVRKAMIDFRPDLEKYMIWLTAGRR